MATLLDKIRYEHQTIHELNSLEGINEIRMLALKLKPLEQEIANDPKGNITIMKPGNIFTDSFQPDLASKITKLIVG